MFLNALGIFASGTGALTTAKRLIIKEELDSFTGENYNFNKNIQLNFNDSILKLFFYLLLSGRTRAAFGKSLCRSQGLSFLVTERKNTPVRGHVCLFQTRFVTLHSAASLLHTAGQLNNFQETPDKKNTLATTALGEYSHQSDMWLVQNCSLTLPSALANTKVLD